MTAETEKYFSHTEGLLALWFGVLAGPIAWLVQMETNYILAQLVCSRASEVALHLISLSALLLAAAGGFTAWRLWQRSGREWPGESGGILPRSRFMAVLGLLMSSQFFLVILAQEIPSLFFKPCQT